LVGELRPFLHDCSPHAGAVGLRRCGQSPVSSRSLKPV
jgi:hypothetical protein